MAMIKERELYVFNSSGAARREKLGENLKLLGYKSSQADDDVWMKQYFKPNGYPYYKYMLYYIGDLIHICFNPEEDMDDLNPIFRLKEGFGPPDRYLGANV